MRQRPAFLTRVFNELFGSKLLKLELNAALQPDF